MAYRSATALCGLTPMARAWQFSVVDATSATARWAMGEYLEELAARFPRDSTAQLRSMKHLQPLTHRTDSLPIVGSAHSPSGCGGVHFLDSERGEIKRMWVAPESRGQGVATPILGYLEGQDSPVRTHHRPAGHQPGSDQRHRSLRTMRVPADPEIQRQSVRTFLVSQGPRTRCD